MAASSKRKLLPGFYKQLNESPVWFLEPVKAKKRTKRSNGLYYAVERLISKRNYKGNNEYLVKWEGYSKYYCSWENEGNLTRDLITSYDKPIIENSRLQENIDSLLHNIILKLKSKSRAPVCFTFDHDCYRYLFGNKGHVSKDGKAFMLEKRDFSYCRFFSNWDQCLDRNGDGVIIHFPIRVRTVLSMSPNITVFQEGELVKQPTMPIEKLKIDFIRKPFSCI